jgi:uncharacterized membrane protein
MLYRIGARKTPNMRDFRSGSLLDRSFHVSIALKGLHALFETIGGIALLMIDPQMMNRLVLTVLQEELSEDPRDFIATHLFRAYQSFASGGKHFAALYLLSHGAVKLVLVLALFRNKLWAYPLMIITLAAFVCYQLYRFALTHSLAMILLTLFDLVVILLTWLEYGKQRSRRQRESPGTTQF